jgi:hypothetical protein
MKKAINLSIFYLILALVSGVFYREFTKWNTFTGRTALSFIHGHMLILGTILFLFAAFLCQNQSFADCGLYKKFVVIHNIALPLMAATLLVRGILQTLGREGSKMVNGMLSGFAGISHILLSVSLVMFLLAIKKFYLNIENGD